MILSTLVAITVFLSQFLSVQSSNKIDTENGCPFSFDVGNLGYEYLKPSICAAMLPEFVKNGTKPMRRGGKNTPKINMELTIFEGTTDTYKLTLTVDKYNQTNFRIWKAVIRVRQVKPEGKLGPGVGFFERKDDFQAICCERSRMRTMTRFLNTKQMRPFTIFVRWVPIRFSGRVVFAANVFSNEKKYVSVHSPVYQVPFEQETPFFEEDEEDWPINDPNIPSL